jgi:hypothetical protein
VGFHFIAALAFILCTRCRRDDTLKPASPAWRLKFVPLISHAARPLIGRRGEICSGIHVIVRGLFRLMLRWRKIVVAE